MSFDRVSTKDRTVHNDAAASAAQNSSSKPGVVLKAERVAKPVIAELNNEKNYPQEIGTASKEDHSAFEREFEKITNPKTYGDYLKYRKLMSLDAKQACSLDDHKFDQL